MTNKQAIEKLNDIRCHVKETSIEEQALVMAIEALKKAGIYGDIIYREDALMCLTGEYPADFKHDELIAKFIRRIKKLPPAQPEQRWIPCSERLPEENGQYIITVKYVHVDGYDDIYAEHGEWADGKWDMFSFGHCGEVESITAWMKLPEPYVPEGGTDGNKADT